MTFSSDWVATIQLQTNTAKKITVDLFAVHDFDVDGFAVDDFDVDGFAVDDCGWQDHHWLQAKWVEAGAEKGYQAQQDRKVGLSKLGWCGLPEFELVEKWSLGGKYFLFIKVT